MIFFVVARTTSHESEADVFIYVWHLVKTVFIIFGSILSIDSFNISMHTCLTYLLGFLNPNSKVGSITKIHQIEFDFMPARKLLCAVLETILLHLSKSLNIIRSMEILWNLIP